MMGAVLPPGAVRDGGRLTSRGRVAPGYPTILSKQAYHNR